MRKINLYFFDVMKNGHIFPSEVCDFCGKIRACKEARLPRLIKFRLSG